MQVNYSVDFFVEILTVNWSGVLCHENIKNYQEPIFKLPKSELLKLILSLYGLNQRPRNFFQRLKYNLEGANFESIDEVYPCIFIAEKVICLVYVDDTFLFSIEEIYIDKAIDILSDHELEIEV